MESNINILDHNVVELDIDETNNIVLGDENSNTASCGQVIPESHQAQGKGINYC